MINKNERCVKRKGLVQLTNIAVVLILVLLKETITECVGFSAGGFAKKSSTGSKKGRRSGNSKKGIKNKKASSSTDSTGSSGVKWQTINLGLEKKVEILVPPNKLEGDFGRQKIAKFAQLSASDDKRAELLEKFGSHRGNGDVIWPSSLQLSRLIANCPSFVNGRNVIDVGCGLGLASLATLLGEPCRLVLSDIDDDVLSLAIQSCTNLIQKNNGNLDTENISSLKEIEKMNLDWSNPSSWPKEKGEFHTVLASDVLYDEDATVHLSELIAHLIIPAIEAQPNGVDGNDEEISRRAILVDPINRLHREKFIEYAAKHGLSAAAVPFPGQEKEFVLINVTPTI